MNREGANPDIYPYTPDDTLLVQFCTKRMSEITSLVGEELEPSIFLGSNSDVCNTSIVGIGYSVNPQAVSAVRFDKRYNSMFGLARGGTTSYYGTYEWNGSPINTHACSSSSYSYNTQRKTYNSQRWTDKETIWNTSAYAYYPVTKLFKGGAVAYFQITAYKELPQAGFNTYNDFLNWLNSSSNYFIGTLAGYQAVKETYPHIFSIEMRVFCGATLGQTRNVETWLFYPQNMKAVGNLLSIWNGSGFTEGYLEGDPLYGQGMEYGCTPQNARVYNYVTTPYLFRGFFNRTVTTQGVIGNVNTSWTVRFGISEYNIIEYVNIGGQEHGAMILFTSFDPDNLISLVTNLGLAVTDQNASVAQNGNIDTNDNIWTPTYDNNGNIDGNSNEQADKEEYTNAGQMGDPIQPNFDPYSGEGDDDEPIPDEDPSEDQKTPEVDLPLVTLNSYGVFHRTYVMNKSQCQNLSNYLWNPDPTTFLEIIEDLKLVGDNVMNSIVSMVMFPFEIPNGGEAFPIRIGRRTTTVFGRTLDTTNLVFEMGTCYCYPTFRNFLDYEPYTKAWLYIPFCGLFAIPLQQFMNKYIDVKLAVDLLTGAGLAIVYADGIPIVYKNCKIGMQIPVTGADSTYSIRNYIEAAEGALSGTSSLINGDVFGTVKGFANAGINALSAPNAPISSNGSSSPQCGMLAPNLCYFIIERPKSLLANVPDYGKLIGYACYKSGNIGTFRGFSIFDNVKLSISHCTDSERNEIISLLRSGVYL